MAYCRFRSVTTGFFCVIVDQPLVNKLTEDFNYRVLNGLRPRTLTAYRQKFRLFVAFTTHLQLSQLDSFKAVSLFIEYLAQQGVRSQTLNNYITVLKHFFSLYNLDVSPLQSRSIQLAIRSVAYNTPLRFKIKGVLTINKLRQLIRALQGIHNENMYKAIMLLGFFGFYRLATLVPTSKASFTPSRYPTHGDVIWGPPGAHILTKCAKNMQISGQSQVVQLPTLMDKELCPVLALRRVVSSNDLHKNKPLFTTTDHGTVLTASRVRLVLRQAVASIGLLPSEFGFHAFRRSGASWAFDHNINLDHIKTHGGWRSDAIWRYLIKTPAAASSVARTFQTLLQ